MELIRGRKTPLKNAVIISDDMRVITRDEVREILEEIIKEQSQKYG
jgi:hypothetical protein